MPTFHVYVALDIDEVPYINKHLFPVFHEGFITRVYTAYEYKLETLFISAVLPILNEQRAEK